MKLGALQTQHRTVTCWGPVRHANLTRRRVLVVGVGSVGLDVAVRLAAAGFVCIGVMDYDSVEEHNLDRLIGATRDDVGRAKIDVARRLMAAASTAKDPSFEFYDLSVCEPDGLAVALDYDIVICCVDRPWPRAVLNQIAYADLIPVVDGGIAIDLFLDGDGMRTATRRAHIWRPGRPCGVCTRQIDLTDVQLDMHDQFDDPEYIAGSDQSPRGGQNVSLLSVGVVADLLAQFVSYNVAPGGFGDPGPTQFLLTTHTVEHLDAGCTAGCPFSTAGAVGDSRLDLTGAHPAADRERNRRGARPLASPVRWRTRVAGRCRQIVRRALSLVTNGGVDRPAMEERRR